MLVIILCQFPRRLSSRLYVPASALILSSSLVSPSQRDLDLSRNGLTRLPADAFSSQGHLLHLLLQGNALKSLPTHVFYPLGKLQSLDVSGNRLTLDPTAPVKWDNLNKLESLDLSDNQISLEILPQGRKKDTGKLKLGDCRQFASHYW